MFLLSDRTLLFLAPAIAMLLTLVCVPAASGLAVRWGCLEQPKKDRWHTRPTPTLGGIAFFVGFLPPVLLLSPDLSAALPFFVIVTLMFIVGMYDDLRQINPAIKLIGQIISAAIAIYFGYSLQFFTWAPLDALLTAIWIVGLTNALNLLDNMDGLAGGIALIAAVYLAFLFNQHGDTQHAVLALALAGAVAGFLLFNFHPASVFMGDAGSLFLGSALALLTVQANGVGCHSNLYSACSYSRYHFGYGHAFAARPARLSGGQGSHVSPPRDSRPERTPNRSPALSHGLRRGRHGRADQIVLLFTKPRDPAPGVDRVHSFHCVFGPGGDRCGE
jgi:UDP-N-acetylmuramyl pentapeptide phosphotransferase/UDP-N-acetylglucosamine-1-phosphate transferase